MEIPDIPVPAFIEAERLDTMTNAEAVKLLYPASWVRMDEGGALYWVLEPGTENLPVTDISWWDAQLFVVWARQQLNLNTLRVPNWAEWVRALHGNHPVKPIDDYDDKGDAGWRWPWGNVVDPHGCNNLNHGLNDAQPRIRDVRRSYGWHEGDTVDGILNMAGNAAEWTRGSRYGKVGDGENYVLKDDPEEPSTSHAFAYGGSYLAGLDDCSVNGRVALRKTERRIDVGFRLVLDPGGGL
jgi:formylglycine-generating enzyme required for sulfatase activity